MSTLIESVWNAHAIELKCRMSMGEMGKKAKSKKQKAKSKKQKAKSKKQKPFVPIFSSSSSSSSPHSIQREREEEEEEEEEIFTKKKREEVVEEKEEADEINYARFLLHVPVWRPCSCRRPSRFPSQTKLAVSPRRRHLRISAFIHRIPQSSSFL